MHHCFPDISGLWAINSYFKGSGAGLHTSFSSFQNPELVAGHSGPAGPLPMPESSSRVDKSLTLQDT